MKASFVDLEGLITQHDKLAERRREAAEGRRHDATEQRMITDKLRRAIADANAQANTLASWNTPANNQVDEYQT